jgi:hypothetical protein
MTTHLATVITAFLLAGPVLGCEATLGGVEGRVEGRTLVDARGASDELYLPAASATGVTSRPLLSGVTYRVVVEGTMSLWHPYHWSSVCVGTPLPSPELRSGGATGPVGVDAEWLWSWPTSSALCQDAAGGPVPRPRRGIVVQASGGGPVVHLPPPLETGMTANHVYTYEIVGTGVALRFLIDDDPIEDNYGVLRIVILPA